MDSRVQEILEKIKREADDEARAESDRLLAEAEARRQEILANAEKEARAITEKARQEARRFEEAGRASLQQAARDLIRSFRGEVEHVLSAIVRNETQARYDEQILTKVIPLVLTAWAEKNGGDLKVLVPEEQLESLETWAAVNLRKTLSGGVELKPLKGLKAGFRIMEKDGAAYYDFSAEAVAEMLAGYLNNHMAALVVEAAR
jgi:V/A-type H+-transporting ATPase subunit E